MKGRTAIPLYYASTTVEDPVARALSADHPNERIAIKDITLIRTHNRIPNTIGLTPTARMVSNVRLAPTRKSVSVNPRFAASANQPYTVAYSGK